MNSSTTRSSSFDVANQVGIASMRRSSNVSGEKSSQTVCQKDIPITEEIQELKRESTKRKLKFW